MLKVTVLRVTSIFIVCTAHFCSRMLVGARSSWRSVGTLSAFLLLQISVPSHSSDKMLKLVYVELYSSDVVYLCLLLISGLMI